MDKYGFIFLAVSMILAGPVYFIVHSKISQAKIPSQFDLFFRTGGPVAQVTVTDALTEQILEREYGASQWIDLGDNQMTSTSIQVQAYARHLLAQDMSFEVILGNGKPNFYYFGGPDMNAPGPRLDTKNFDIKTGADRKPHIARIVLSRGAHGLTIQGLRVGELVFEPDANPRVYVHDSQIRRVEFKESTQLQTPSLRLANTWVNTVIFRPSSVGDFEVRGGGIKNLICPAPYEGNPFSGDVKFADSAQLSLDGGTGIFGVEQSRRSLRAHLSELSNLEADRYVLGFEKRLERPKDPIFIRFVSVLYDAVSFYGNFPSRSGLWFILVTIYSFALVFSFDGAPQPEFCFDEKVPTNWTQGLCHEGIEGRAFRSFVLSIQPILNPIGFLSSKNIVVPANFWINLWQTIQGLTSLVLLGLLFFGLRRKFVTG